MALCTIWPQSLSTTLQISNCRKAIIYCRTVHDINELFAMFVEKLGACIYEQRNSKDTRLVEMFSSALSDRNRSRILRQFTNDTSLRVVICTIAFGMGIDIPNIRNIVLWGVPDGVCHLWQQVGRCCRDGTPGVATVFRKAVPDTPKEVREIFRRDST